MLVYPSVWELYYSRLLSCQKNQIAAQMCSRLGESLKSVKFNCGKHRQFMYSEAFNDGMIAFRKETHNILAEPVF